MRRALASASILALAGCAADGPPVSLNDGYTHISQGGTFECTGQPVSFDARHADASLEGACTRLRVTGSHDDITVYVVPGATIEVTGGHNDIVYRLIRRGPAPTWVNRGEDNSLIRNSRAPWEQDHDWYQEQH